MDRTGTINYVSRTFGRLKRQQGRKQSCQRIWKPRLRWRRKGFLVMRAKRGQPSWHTRCVSQKLLVFDTDGEGGELRKVFAK